MCGRWARCTTPSSAWSREPACAILPRTDSQPVSVALAFVSVARLEDIPGDRGLRVEVAGVGVGLYRVGDRVYAMEDACPHAGFHLSQGELEGCVVTCLAHGWLFDVRTGFDPHHADGFPVPCFAVQVEGGEVRIDLDARVNDPPRRSNPKRSPPEQA